jgi:hypothetical protein
MRPPLCSEEPRERGRVKNQAGKKADGCRSVYLCFRNPSLASLPFAIHPSAMRPLQLGLLIVTITTPTRGDQRKVDLFSGCKERRR